MNQDVWGDGSHEITRTVPQSKSFIYLHYFRVMLGKAANALQILSPVHRNRNIVTNWNYRIWIFLLEITGIINWYCYLVLCHIG